MIRNEPPASVRVADDDHQSDLGGCKIGRKQLMLMKATSGMQDSGEIGKEVEGNLLIRGDWDEL